MNDTAKLIRLKCNVNRNGIHLPSISIFTNGIPPPTLSLLMSPKVAG